MDKTSGKLTVYFEDPFWVGVFELVSNGRLSVCRVTFGAEPKDCEVWDFVLHHYFKLKFGAAVKTDVHKGADNPKRRRREAEKQIKTRGVGTKSQQALKAQYEEMKAERKEKSRAEREAEKERRFFKKQQKKKEKHRGR
ncbi:MAG: YjdF family protein [Clostridia bacterium]|nr:YjdF family protein [Clostridia bacterium]